MGSSVQQFLALRFPILSDDGVTVAVCTKLIDLSVLDEDGLAAAA